MLYLKTFGGLSLVTQGSSDAVLTRRRPLALICALAAAAPLAVPRDKILALLWSDAGEERGRNALNQTLFALRREVDEPELILGRAELRLNPSLVDSDITAFDRAYAAGDFNTAADLYAGPFLDGFFLTDAPEFERWVEEMRARLARRAGSTFLALAAAAEREGNVQRAAELRWRMVDADPLDSRAALGLVRSLAAGGDRARALQVARRHESLLREEIGSGVDPDLARFIEELLSEGRMLPSVALELPEQVPSPPPPLRSLASSGGPLSVRSRRRRVLGTVATIVVIVLLTAIALARPRGDRASVTDRAGLATAVAVLPFAVRGPPDVAYLRDALPELLGRSLDGTGALRIIDKRVVHRAIVGDSGAGTGESAGKNLDARLRADHYIIGEVVATPTSIRITATVARHANGQDPLPSLSVDGSPDDLLQLVDRLAARIVVALQPRGRLRATDVATLSTHSLPALKAFIEGESRRRAGQYAQAMEAYQTAVREDSTFALAWYGLSNASDWASRSDLVLHAARQADRFADLLTEHDRLLIRAYLAWRDARSAEAERWYRILLHGYPDDAEAWYQFAELLFHDNSRRGRSFVEAREPFLQVLALQPDDRESLLHLVRIAARTGAIADVDSLTTRALRVVTPAEALELHALRAYAIGDTLAQNASLRALKASDGASLTNVAWRVSTFSTDLAGAENILRLGLAAGRPVALQTDVRSALQWVLMGRGRYREAWEESLRLEDARPAGDASDMQARLYLLVAPDTPLIPGVAERTRRQLDSLYATLLRRHTAADSSVAHTMLCFAAILDASDARPIDARRSADVLESVRVDPVAQRRVSHCAVIVRALIQLKAGQVARGLDALLSEHEQRVPESTPEPLSRLLIADALHALGRDSEARGWYSSMSERGLEELPLFAPAERRLAQIAQRAGDMASAARHFRRFIKLWEDCDPELRPLVEEARRELKRVEARLKR